MVTTINPCKSQDISLCFKLISEQMNRTEQLLNMANQTLTNSDIPAEVLPPTGESTIAKQPVAGRNQVGNQQKVAVNAPVSSDNSQQSQAATSMNNVPQTVPVQNIQPIIPTNQVQPSQDNPLSSVVPVQNNQPMNPTNQAPASQNTPTNNVLPVQNQNQAQSNPVQQPSNMEGKQLRMNVRNNRFAVSYCLSISKILMKRFFLSTYSSDRSTCPSSKSKSKPRSKCRCAKKA